MTSAAAPGRVYACHPILERLAADFPDLARACGPLIQPQEAMVHQEPLPRHGHLAAANHTHLGDGVVGGLERAHRDEGGAPPVRPATRGMRVVSRAAARRFAGMMVARRRASLDVSPWGAEHRQIMDRTPAALPASPLPREESIANTVDPLSDGGYPCVPGSWPLLVLRFER
jgi:hypothetical protein